MFFLRGLFPLFTFVFLFAGNLIAQSDKLFFKNITTEKGLSHGEIYSVFQDHQGYIWFGTTDGLNKFDGVSLTVYKHIDNDKNSLSSSIIACVYEDKQNNLWIGVANGLCLYNAEKNNFEAIQYPDNDGAIFDKSVRVIFEDTENSLWIGTLNGVYMLDKKNKKFIYCFDQFYEKNNIIQCTDIIQDSYNNLWFSFNNQINGGIIIYNPKTKATVKYNTQSNVLPLQENNVEHLLLDFKDNVWIGYDAKGIDVFDKNKKFIKNFRKQLNNNKTINCNSIYSFLRGFDGKILIGTDGGGLNIYNPVSETFTYYNYSEKQNSLLGNSIPAICISKDSTLWISCWNSGISLSNKYLKRFTHFKNEKSNNSSLAGMPVTCFAQDIYGNIWVSTDGGGINLYNISEENFSRNLNIPTNPNSLTNNKVLALETDKNGGLWAGMWQGGINYFQVIDKKLVLKKKYDLLDPFDPHSNSIFKIYRDKEDNIWVGTFHKGLFLYDKKKDGFSKIELKNKSGKNLSGDNINDILNDNKGNLWIALQDDGLLKYNRHSGETKIYTSDINKDNSLKSGYVNVIHIDSKNNLWIGLVDGGLGLYDPETDSFRSFTTLDGLPDNTVVGILEDSNGNLWISHHNGISKVTVIENKGAVSLKMQYYNEHDGLQGKIFHRWAYFKSKSGEMYFGGLNGFNVFHPDSIIDNPLKPKVFFTDFLLFNKPVKVGEKGSLFAKHISQLSEITLSPDQNNFTINFIALNFILSENNQYAYIMEGLDKDWTYSGNKNSATYNGISPGRYTFRVKASNNDLVWNNEGVSLKITILPPWYKSLWIKLLLQLCLFVLIIIIILKIINRIEKRANQTILNERNQLKTLINNIPDYIFIKDKKLRYLIVNKSGAEFLGAKSEEELIGLTDYELNPKEEADQMVSQEQDILLSGKPILNKEYIIKSNGKETIVSVTKSPIINNKNEKIGILCIFRDITLQKNAENEIIRQSEELKNYNVILSESNDLLRERQCQIEEQSEELHSTNERLIEHQKKIEEQANNLKEINSLLKKKNEELLILNATKDKFFSIIAHDLRNPFNVVSGFSEILSKNFAKMPHDKIKKYLEMIYSSSTSGNNLLENLLQWSRSQTGRISFEPIKLNLLSVAEETIKLLEGEAEHKNITLKQLIEPDIIISADENMLKTIFRNLISNAIKFTYVNGVVTLKSQINNSAVEITVADTGIGIDKENIDKLFNISTIVSTKGTSNERGTGLGLILCKDFIERHNGRIFVKSEEGKGSEFVFTLPI